MKPHLIFLAAGLLVVQSAFSQEHAGARSVPAPGPPSRPRAVRRPPDAELVRRIDALVQPVLDRGAPAVSISVRRGGNLALDRAYGLWDREASIEATTEFQFQIGSVSKQFAAAAIMRLVEEGLLSVSDPISLYVPELDTKGHTVTIQQLMQHTSGLPNYTEFLTDAYTPMTQDEMLRLIESRPFTFAPGVSWAYSNSGYYLLGMIVERVSGQTFAQYLKETFFRPLQLDHTSYCGANALLPTPDGYYREPGTGNVVRVEAVEMSLVSAAGAICSTPHDLALWSAALHSGWAVSGESYAAMITPARLNSGASVPYGYGLVIGRYAGRRVLLHDGSILGFRSHLAVYPDDEVTVAVLINITDLERDDATALGLAIAREVLR